MKKFHELNILVQIIACFITGFIALYGGSWLLAPYFQSVDDVHCGINVLLHMPCSRRFSG